MARTRTARCSIIAGVIFDTGNFGFIKGKNCFAFTMLGYNVLGLFMLYQRSSI